MNGQTLFQRRRDRVRFKLRETSKGRLRLSIHRSNLHIYAQIIDDDRGVTLAAASSQDKELRSASGANKAAAEAVGKLVAERALAAGVTKVVFDRGGYIFHGRVKSLADAARSAGLEF